MIFECMVNDRYQISTVLALLPPQKIAGIGKPGEDMWTLICKHPPVVSKLSRTHLLSAMSSQNEETVAESSRQCRLLGLPEALRGKILELYHSWPNYEVCHGSVG